MPATSFETRRLSFVRLRTSHRSVRDRQVGRRSSIEAARQARKASGALATLVEGDKCRKTDGSEMAEVGLIWTCGNGRGGPDLCLVQEF